MLIQEALEVIYTWGHQMDQSYTMNSHTQSWFSGCCSDFYVLLKLLIHQLNIYSTVNERKQALSPLWISELTLSCLTASPALEGEQVGIVSVTAQAEVRPPDGITLSGVQNEFGLGELHSTRSQLVPFIIHICHLQVMHRSKTQSLNCPAV